MRARHFVVRLALALLAIIISDVLYVSRSQPRLAVLSARPQDGAPGSVARPAVIVTLVGGDTAARNAVAMLQSLRDVNTTLDLVVLLAEGALGAKRAVTTRGSGCTIGPMFTVAAAILSVRVLGVVSHGFEHSDPSVA